LEKLNCRNSIVRNLKTRISKNKIKISFGDKLGLGYDGCGTHTHGYGIQSNLKTNKSK